MALAIDPNEILREAVTGQLAAHIRARLAANACKLSRGSPEGHARYITRRWKIPSVSCFWILSREQNFVTLAEVATAAGCPAKTAQDFWRKVLGALAVTGTPHDHAGAPKLIRLFRYGHERGFALSGGRMTGGVKLQCEGKPFSFAIARHMTDSTLALTVTLRQNYDGGCDVQEADETKAEAERTAARTRMSEGMTDAAAPAQVKLFGA